MFRWVDSCFILFVPCFGTEVFLTRHLEERGLAFGSAWSVLCVSWRYWAILHGPLHLLTASFEKMQFAIWSLFICWPLNRSGCWTNEGSVGTSQLLRSEVCPQYCMFRFIACAFDALSLYCSIRNTRHRCWRGNIPPQRNISRLTKELCGKWCVKHFSQTRKLWN